MKMNRKIILIALFTALAISSCFKWQLKPSEAQVGFMLGDVKVNGNATFVTDDLRLDDKVSVGNDSVCDIKIQNHLIRIYSNSEIQLTAIKDKVRVTITKGTLLCQPAKMNEIQSFVVRGPSGVAGLVGNTPTRFSVDVDKFNNTRIIVYDGWVKFAKRFSEFDGQEDLVIASGTKILKGQKSFVILRDIEMTRKKLGGNAKTELIKNISVFRGRAVKMVKADYKYDAQLFDVTIPTVKEKVDTGIGISVIVYNGQAYLIQGKQILDIGKIIQSPKGGIIVTTKQVIGYNSRNFVKWNHTFISNGKFYIKGKNVYVGPKRQGFVIQTGKKL